MEEIKFTASYADINKEVAIAQPNGDGTNFHITIDNFYQGIMMKLNDEWTGYFNAKNELTSDDVLILGEMIDEQW